MKITAEIKGSERDVTDEILGTLQMLHMLTKMAESTIEANPSTSMNGLKDSLADYESSGVYDTVSDFLFYN